MQLDLSISIISYNTKDLLRSCLKSIYEFNCQINYEIIVVDNASSDGSPEMVETEFSLVRLIRNRMNIGFSRANNQALNEAAGSLYLLLNPDCLFTDDSLCRMLDFMNTHPSVGILGCKIINPDGHIEFSAEKYPDFFNELLLKLRKRFSTHSALMYKAFTNYYNEIRETDWVTGACLLVRSEVYRDVQGMDERFFLYFEDVDLCKRVKEKRWKIIYVNDCEVMHLKGKSMAKMPSMKMLQTYRTSQLYYYQKHNPRQYPVLKFCLKLLRLI